MKKLLFLGLLLTGYTSFSQSNPIKLVKGQKISVVTTNNGDADLGMGTMKNNTINTNLIIVTGENDKEYILTNTLTKVKMEMDAMGKTMNYDSENPEDKDSEIATSMADIIGKPVNITINKITAETTSEKKEKDPEKEANPMEDMMGAFGNTTDPSISGVFLVIPTGKKTGDSWTIKDSTNEKRSVKTYTINSIMNNIASITVKANTDANSSIEANGTQLDITTNTKVNGEMLVDVSTGMVNRNSVNSDISATIDVMGQTMPMTAKNKTVSVYSLLAD